jgi:transposase InsO family protein
VVGRPGALVQLDTMHVQRASACTLFQFRAVDCFTRKRVFALAPGLTSQQDAAFLKRLLVQFPFPVQALQSDGGSEFLDDFSRTAAELKLTHYFNSPNNPQGSGRIEGSFRTDEEESCQVEELPADIGGLEAALIAWNHLYETVRPHQALGDLTPEQFHQRWITNHQSKEAVSDMSSPSTAG